MDQPPTPSTPPAYAAPAATPGVFGTKIPSVVAFAAAVLLFLLPFSEIKCGGTVLANKSGLDIAMKKDWKPVNSGMFGKKDLTDMTTKSNTEEKGISWIFGIAALGLGILGLLLSFSKAKAGISAGLVSGVLSAVALIGMMIQIKKEFNDSIAKSAMDTTQQDSDSLGFNKLGDTLNNAKPTLDFTPWFYVAIIAFLAAAFFCYKRMQSVRN